MGGAAFDTLFFGTGALDAGLLGGPFEAGPAGGVDCLGAKGDCVTFDPPSTPFAGALDGGPFPIV